MPCHANLHSPKALCPQVEYIDAVDATDEIIHLQHLRTYDYILSQTSLELSNIDKCNERPFISRRPFALTYEVNLLKKNVDEESKVLASIGELHENVWFGHYTIIALI